MSSPVTTKTVTVAFDIETSGSSFVDNNIIAIGASAMDENFNELESLRLNGFLSGQVIFEPKTWDEYWSKNLILLESFVYQGEFNTADSVEAWMIRQLQAFRKKYELYAQEIGAKYFFVSDNNVFDGGFVNCGILHLGEIRANAMPIPYSASTGDYSAFFETTSMQKGFLLGIDPEFDPFAKWGFSNRIAQLYDVPSQVKQHDHSPENDAYSIAYDFNVLLAIRQGRIKKR